MTCERCGHCCMTAFMAQDNIPIDKDEKEIGRWLYLHHCDVMKYPSPKGDVLAVRIPLVCKWLEYDEEAGCYRCKEYEHRPIVCRQYFCKRAKETAIKELADGLDI